jgi:N-acetylglutamate synthase-like GNAT family acetyltransferase
MSEEELKKIVEFYEKYLGTHDETTAKSYIKEHLKYGTVDYAVDEKGNVIGLCRWNIDGTIAKIIDLAIAPEWRKKGLGKHFLVRGLKLWKNVTHIEFERGFRGDHRRKKIPVEFILKRNMF